MKLIDTEVKFVDIRLSYKVEAGKLYLCLYITPPVTSDPTRADIACIGELRDILQELGVARQTEWQEMTLFGNTLFGGAGTALDIDVHWSEPKSK